jgi:hypothetical protein
MRKTLKKDGNISVKKARIIPSFWEQLIAKKEMVNKAIEEDRSFLPMRVAGRYKVDYKFFFNKWYIGFFEYTEHGTIIGESGFNFRKDEWVKMMDNEDKICQELGMVPKKRDSEGNVKPDEIKMYKWKWMMGKKKLSESKLAFYSESACVEDSNFCEQKNVSDFHGKEPTRVIEVVECSLPCFTLLMRQAYLYVLSDEVEKISHEKCIGCKNDAPGQEAHMMSGGCLIPKEDLYGFYTSEARNNIQQEKVIELFHHARSYLHLTHVESTVPALLFKACQAYISRDKCNELMQSKTHQNMNILLREVCFSDGL